MAGSGRAALLIAGNDLRRRLRNGSFLVQAFIGPVLLASVISAAFAGGFGFEVEIGIITEDRSELARGIARGLVDADDEDVRFRSVEDVASARRLIDEAEIGAAIVLPDGFSRSLGTEDPRPVGLVLEEQSPVPGAVARAVAQGISARVDAARLTIASFAASGREPPAPEALADLELPVLVDRESSDEVSPAALVAPGMGLLFLFFTVAAVARTLLEEKRQRVLDRVRAAPVTLTAILIGKAIGIVVLGLTSVLTLWATTAVLLGADWGNPLGVLLVVTAATLAVGGISGLVAAAASTEQAADLAATAVAFILGMLGGSLVPQSELPETLRRVSLFTPNGWAQQAFAELSAGSAGVREVLPEVGVLLAWATVAIVLASVLIPRRLVPR